MRIRALILLLLIPLGFSMIGSGARAAEETSEPENAPLPEKVIDEVVRITRQIERQDDEKAWKEKLSGWEAVLESAERYLDDKNYSTDKSRKLYREVTEIGAEASQVRESVEQELIDAQQLLETLGPVPGRDQIQESDEISKKRALYLAEVTQIVARITQIDLSRTRAEALSEQLSSLRRELLIDRLQKTYPIPLKPATIAAAVPEFFTHAAATGGTVLTWLESLNDAFQNQTKHYLFAVGAVLMLVVLLLLRRFLLQRYGRDPEQANPSYSRRTVAALVEVFATGGIPAIILVAGYEALDRSKAVIAESLSVPVEAALISVFIFILLSSFVRTAFSPRLPAWRLIRLTEQSAYGVGSILIALIAVFAIDAFFRRAFAPLEVSAELISVMEFGFLILEAVPMLVLCLPFWWRVLPVGGDEGGALQNPGFLWVVLRRLVALSMVAALAVTAAGYIPLGDYLFENAVRTTVVVALLFSMRAILHETVGAMVQTRLLRQKLELRIVTLARIKFWINAAVDPLILLAGSYVVVRIWGVPEEDLLRWAQVALTGFSIGSITISLVDILSAIALFIIGMLITRALQRVVLKHVMPQVTENVGMHHSIAAGVGYLGLVVALTVGVAALGIDLSNVALIAGALSVGIGFGLQNIVSNFVSGIILIFEQPIKVDDWVMVNGQEGMVKRINFRATEIETFDKSSVLIPNADLLANPVTNRTLKDRYGRIEVAVSVAYGSDTKLVEKLLLESVAEQQHVVKHPAPFVLFQNFGADGLDFEVRCYTSDVIYKALIASAIRFSIDQAFREAGIDIPFPQRVVHFANPQAVGYKPEPDA
ncbi:MAG: mechanosensitive ion channel domain-containing protein [Pseudomonadota bacterium]